MRIDPAQISSRQMYYHLIGSILPRPVAWVSTCDADGRVNLAPFSFFMGVAARPPTLAISVAARSGGGLKDTAANVLSTGELVVNVVPAALLDPMVRTSAEVDPEVDEFELAGLERRPSERVRPPRVAQSPIAFECVRHAVLPITAPDADGAPETTAHLFVARVLLLHIDEAVLDAQGRVDDARLDPIARLGGAGYARLGERLRVSRPAEG